MGAYQGIFEKTEDQAKINLNPSKADWITGHADLTGLAVVEVERLWIRFKQLGADKNGYVSKKLLEKGELGQDAFVKNIIANLPKEKDGSLSFVVFLRLIQWSENSDLDEKLKVIFNYINNGRDIDLATLTRMYKKVYPTISDNELANITDVFMYQMDERKTGKISENAFIYNVKRLIPPRQLESYLKFDIIPPEIMESVNMEPSISGSMISMRNAREDIDLSSAITDAQLELIAQKITRKNWERLAQRLGYLDYDIDAFKAQNRGNITNTINDILKSWRDQDPYLATPERLRGYLQEFGMLDAAIVLE